MIRLDLLGSRLNLPRFNPICPAQIYPIGTLYHANFNLFPLSGDTYMVKKFQYEPEEEYVLLYRKIGFNEMFLDFQGTRAQLKKDFPEIKLWDKLLDEIVDSIGIAKKSKNKK